MMQHKEIIRPDPLLLLPTKEARKAETPPLNKGPANHNGSHRLPEKGFPGF